MASFDKSETLQKVTNLIVSELKVDPSSIKIDKSFADLGVDSLDMVQIIMKCEEQFGLEIPDDVAEKFNNINDLVDYINARRSK